MSLPPTNSTALDDGLFYGWMSPPQTRGTSDILYTCLTTIVLCVYTAVHLNIPAPGEQPRWQALRQAKWTFIGIIAPEIVLFTAWNQYCQASNLVRELNAMSSTEQQSGHSQPGAFPAASQSTDKLDLKYGFYAVMGGFRVNVEGFSDTMTTAALSSNAIITLAREGVHCYIDPSTIEDKSKADNLAKILVMFQVSWMVVQCIARKVSGLPLTLLEIHTFIHAVCAAILYAFWFNKPLNIGEASVIQVPQRLEGLVACLFLRSKSYHIATLDGLDEHPKDARISVTSRSLYRCKESKPPVTSTRATGEVLRRHTARQQRPFRKVYHLPENLPNTTKVAQFWIPITDCYHGDIVLSPQLARCALAASRHAGSGLRTDKDASGSAVFLLERLQNMIALDNTEQLPADFVDWIIYPLETVLGSCTGLITAGDLPPIKTRVAATLVQVIYGGVHFSAWEVAFPGNLEQLLWRVSCILIATLMITAFFGCLGMMFVCLTVHETRESRFPCNNSDSIRKRIIAHLWGLLEVLATVLALILLPLSLLLILATGAARCYIVVESFISLRVVPAGVYKAIEWADYIPHI